MEFRNEYGFLSNMAPSPVTLKGVTFPSVENAFQAMKTLDPEDWARFARLTPAQAKRAGRTLPLRKDWEDVKLLVMQECLKRKFADPALMRKLRGIPGHIQEDNSWGDTFWGVCRGRGRNELGRLLMER